MEMQNLPNNVISVKLSSSEKKISDELKELNESISQQSNVDVIIDFSNVEIINSSNISNLLILRGFVEKNRHRLFFYNVQTITRCIFVVAGLTDSFIFIDDLEDTLKAVQNSV